MSKLNRILWSGLVLVGAACGDDVTVTPPPEPPAPGIRSVTVAPDGATIAVGATLTFTAAVTTDPGAATPTIAWSSSNTAVATVNATTGEVTAVAVGSVGIRATATSGTSTGSGVATLNVSSSAVTPATVSIQSVEQGGAPANLLDLENQVDVRVNLERGGEAVQKVQLLVDGTVVQEQVFASASAQASAPELAIEEIVFPWNTADFDPATGTPKFLNGNHNLSARVITAQNESGTGSPTLQVRLDNSNRGVWNVEILDGATALDDGGLLWETGDLKVSVLPVIYSVANPTIAQVVINPDGLLSKVDVAGPFEQTWAKGTDIGDGGSGGEGFTGIEDGNFAVCGSATANGQPVNLGCSDEDVFTGEDLEDRRFDNNGPGAPEFAANPNIRQNGWINAGVALTGLNPGSATSNNWLVAGTPDNGVGGYAITLRTDGTAPATVDAAVAAAGSATPTLPAPSLNNNSYCAVASGTDLLGNESLMPAAGTPCFAPPVASFDGVTTTGTNHLRFGVDIAAPTIAFSGGLASNARLNGGTVGGEFQVTVTDTGTVGNSGMLSGSAVRGTVQIRSKSLTPPSATSCFIGAFAAAACGPVSVNPTPAFPLVPTTTVAASDTVGYYTYSAFSQDAAGNQSAPVTRVIAFDPAANVPALTAALFNTPLTGPTVTFNANASDNFDLWKADYTLTYAGGLAGPLAYPSVILNAFNQAPLVNSNVPAGITINGFLRQVEDVTGNAPLTVGGAFKPVQLDGTVTDQANNTSATATTVIPPAAVTTGVSFTAAPAAQLINSWAITSPAAAVNVSDNAGPAAAANPLSVAINVDAFGPTATFSAPFVRVDFYALVGGNLQQIGSTTSFSTVDDGSAFGRRHRYTFTWTPGTTVPLGLQTIYAVGVNASGDGLVTQANTNITTTNP
jgi:hypothetical protein